MSHEGVTRSDNDDDLMRKAFLRIATLYFIAERIFRVEGDEDSLCARNAARKALNLFLAGRFRSYQRRKYYRSDTK